MPKEKFRKEYQPLNYHIHHVDLHFDLDQISTYVRSDLHVRRTEHGFEDSPLVLDGKELEFVSVMIDGRFLNSHEYEVSPDKLTIYKVPEECIIHVENIINPTANTSCSGLYRSDNIYTTQCESENFRRITYYQDRPDNLATFTTTIIADKLINPLMLSNGNVIEEKTLNNQKHLLTFHDPSPKPSYLFALVAGNLRTVQDYFFSEKGKKIDLKIHVRGEKVAKTTHAMDVLKKAFKWDEETYRLPYDLGVYNIVGVPDFNAGAMENKGLNIFNDDSLLVSPQTGVDADYTWIYTVVGHEFFHHYAGNLVTIRDWFNLSLKEGLATQKEREFLADMIGYTLPRIKNVKTLKAVQFPEDAGPNAHAVRSESYIDISNFYTTTTYQKGAELLSMLSGLLGQDTWRKGVRAYFQTFDGQAATIEEFLGVLSDVSGKDLTQFDRWYAQAGTPILDFEEHYNESKQMYTLKIKQSCSPDKETGDKLPFHIPIKMGLLDEDGQDILLHLHGEDMPRGQECILEMTEAQQSFTFVGVKSKPVPSLLRDFSAPVKIGKSMMTEQALVFLMRHDSNEFNRWDAAQQLHERLILKLADDFSHQRLPHVPNTYLEACERVLKDSSLNPGLRAEILTLPNKNILLDKMQNFDLEALNKAYDFVRCALGGHLKNELFSIYRDMQEGIKDIYTPEFASRRALKNYALKQLVFYHAFEKIYETPIYEQCYDQFLMSHNMTDKISALESVATLNFKHCGPKVENMRATMMDQFYQAYKDDPQVVDKWLQLQAMYDDKDTISHMKSMLKHEAFSLKNPNNVRSLIRVFMRSNLKHFHHHSGAGYSFVKDVILQLKDLNASMASDMAHVFVSNTRLDAKRINMLKNYLLGIKASNNLPSSLEEVVSKALKQIAEKPEVILKEEIEAQCRREYLQWEMEHDSDVYEIHHSPTQLLQFDLELGRSTSLTFESQQNEKDHVLKNRH